MDISTASGALIITVLRLLHIVAGLIWVGAAILMSCYIEPALERAGAGGSPFLRALYRDSSFPRLIPLSALITTVAGLLLYGLMSYHEAMSSSMGMVLTLGALFGLLAFGHGYFAVWRGCRPPRRDGRKRNAGRSRAGAAPRQDAAQRARQHVAGGRLTRIDGRRTLHRSRARLGCGAFEARPLRLRN